MSHWEECCGVIWSMVLLAAVVLLHGCSSRFYEAAPEYTPDTSDCGEIERTFVGSAPWTPTPFPFKGSQSAKMWAKEPVGWNQFAGQLYLTAADWNITWVSYMRMGLGPYPNVAVWDGDRWNVDPRIDLMPYIEQSGGYLIVEPTFFARGTKPAGRVPVPVTITLAVCGVGQDGVK